MLSRHRELYNLLTHSEAYSEKGRADANKVNKNKFTPHNLKALVLGANSAIAVYYTTGGVINSNIWWYKFKDSPKKEADIIEYAKNNKEAMVEVLYKNIIFSNIEEIIFVGGDFASQNNPYMSEEYMKELNSLNLFAKNPMAHGNFNRLGRIITCDNFRIDETMVKNIEGFFKKIENPQNARETFDRRRLHFGHIGDLFIQLYGGKELQIFGERPALNELGVLPASSALESLNKGDYIMDSRCPDNLPANDDSPQYRLYRFFSKEEKYIDEVIKNKHKKKDAVSRGYVSELLKEGYKQINNVDTFLGKKDLANKIMKWLKSTCVEKPDSSTGYQYKTCYMYADLLKEKGIKDTKDANIWNAEIYQKSPDLEFRIFIKENDYGMDVIIKLPIGLNQFVFTDVANDSIALIMSNTNAENGKTFQCSIMESPQLKSLRETHNVNCVYEAIEFSLSKNLAEFAKSNWLFLDYLRACNGEKNVFSNFRELPLGEKVVIGVKTNSLKTERFDCSGQNQTSGLICGQAGSGKSALMDSMVLQFLALKGDYGNGAVVLMDAKQEWPPLWKSAFESIGVPFYGFDGSYLSNQDSLKKREISQSGKVSIVNFKESITQEVGGMMLMMALYNVIQKILKESGCKDVKTFNKSNKNYNGITRLPRIAILIDEMNTFAVNAQKGTVAGGIMPVITGGANLTRTAGYMWFLCGQDVPKKILPADQRSSFKYNIMGTMDKERYEYFDVDENPNVVAYEAKTATSDNPHPIMKQGTFYAGVKGKTELIRSLYLPDEEKVTALNLLNSSFEGMRELDALVRYALQNNMFDAFTQGVGGLNNIIYATLRDIGVISDDEFEEATARIFGEEKSSNAEEDYWNMGNELEETTQDISIVTPNQNNQEKSQMKPQSSIQSNANSNNYNSHNEAQNSQRPQRPQRPNQPINTQNTSQNTSQNDRYTVSDKNYYRGKIDVQDNPFTKYTSGSNTDTLLTVKDMTRILMDDIRKNVCPDDMVTSFMIADSTLFINEVIYEPTFDNAFMQSLPQSLRMKVENGQMAEFFDLRQVYKYKNLEKFGLMDELLAQGRARKEMAIGFRKRWSVLFRKFKRLQLIQVGDIKYFRENPDSNAEDSLLEKFKNNPALTYAKGNGVGFMDKVWDSRPVRAITRGLGWTMGVQTVWFAASLMGPWGLLFGAIAAASVYNDTKKRNQMNSTNNQNQYK